MPGPIGERGRAALGLDAEDLSAITARANDNLRVLGLRFTNDRGCPPERFETLRATLGHLSRGSRSTRRRATRLALNRPRTQC